MLEIELKRTERNRICAGKRVVDFLLVLIKFFSLALMAAALLSEICRNLRFPTGVGHFERKLSVDGYVARRPSMDR